MTTVVLTPGGFPRRLQKLPYAQLYTRGALADPTCAIAIVGARAATVTAMDRAHAIARHLAGRGVHVVSGGALGIDGAAHRGALAGGGTTTVVLGSGCDVPYPARHASLFVEAIARGGAIVSLLPDGTQPRAGTFVARNPLIAALADAVLVIEADVRSGSLSTARAAQRLGRLVAAWPGSRGCDRLLADGAAILESIDDADLVARGTPRTAAARPIADLDPEAARIRAAIADGAVGIDAIVRHTGLTLRAVLRVLPTLSRCS